MVDIKYPNNLTFIPLIKQIVDLIHIYIFFTGNQTNLYKKKKY